MLDNKYGRFSEDGKEFIITNPYTPRPWINVISNGEYSLIVSQTGGGYSFYGNAEQNRITRSFQDIVKDNWGKYIYLRDADTGELWSAALNPVKENVDAYEVTHGMGYSVLKRRSFGIDSALTVFAANELPMEYLKLELFNDGEKERNIEVTGYFEWALGIAYDTHREFQRLFYDLSFDERHNALIAEKCLWGFPDKKGRHSNDDWPYRAFFACSEKVDSYDSDKESFIGMYGDEKRPAAFDNGKLNCSRGRYCDPVAALRTFVTVPRMGTRTVVFALGLKKKDQGGIEDYLNLCSQNNADAELNKVKERWNALTAREITTTPDKAFDVMTNYWTKYQAISCRMWAKAAYYQISGGIGYRDQLQDSLIALESEPNLTRSQILLHASKQFQSGDVMHWWLTYNNAGPRTKCSDDYLWLPFAVNAYLDETRDETLLTEKVCFADGGEDDVYGHCKKALSRAFTLLSPRGIPLMGDHDWNDGLSAVGNDMKGESFWVAEFLFYVAVKFVTAAQEYGDKQFAKQLLSKCAELQINFNKYAWDGKWFLQATNDEGAKIGSSENKEGKIFLNPQLWAAISRISDNDRVEKAMAAVKKYLLKDYGALLLSPEYRTPDENIGYITRYAPGLRENGGVYTHAATWAVWAFALLKDGETAYNAYSRICSPNRGSDIDVFKSEPYVLCGNSDGPASPYFGKGGWSWYTGSAQWLHRVAVQYILGVRPVRSGLQIDPCLPKEWDKCGYIRNFRGGRYEIEFVRTGQKRIFADGKEVKGDVIDCGKGTHKITVQF